MTRPWPSLVFGTAVILCTTCSPGQSGNSSIALREPGPDDRCPVCGMVVVPHPQWLAQVVHEDGSTTFFDGTKDMFRYLADREKYLPEKSTLVVVGIYVTDYYTTDRIPAQRAYFVVGSDVAGPMGAELVPHRSRSDAEEFGRDHGASSIVQFEDVRPDLLSSL